MDKTKTWKIIASIFLLMVIGILLKNINISNISYIVFVPVSFDNPPFSGSTIGTVPFF